jgi:hypothetical protein
MSRIVIVILIYHRHKPQETIYLLHVTCLALCLITGNWETRCDGQKRDRCCLKLCLSVRIVCLFWLIGSCCLCFCPVLRCDAAVDGWKLLGAWPTAVPNQALTALSKRQTLKSGPIL